MGLITEEVEVKLGVRNIKYYENLGYKIPRYENKNHKMTVKRGTTINVFVKDLSHGSNVAVRYRCDRCNNIFKTRYDIYSEHNNNGKTYCLYCSGIRDMEVSIDNTKQKLSKKKHYESRKRPATAEYNDFIKKVLKRDNYECQCCHKKENLVVHHLDSYNWCIDKRADETNGITLCDLCHKNFHITYGRGNNTKKQFEEWIGESNIYLEKYDGELPTARKIYCIEEDKVYDNAQQIMDQWGLKGNQEIYKMCSHYHTVKSVKGKHLLWLNEFENMSEEDIKQYLEKCKYKKRGRRQNLIS